MQQTIVIGQVLKPQGVRGEVKVKPLLDDAADIKHIPRVTIAGKEYKVLSARCDASFAYLGLAGVADRDAAELLRGKPFFVFQILTTISRIKILICSEQSL